MVNMNDIGIVIILFLVLGGIPISMTLVVIAILTKIKKVII